MDHVFAEIAEHVLLSRSRFDGFASTHEALGVALEEWNELQQAIQANDIEAVCNEAVDLAAVMVNLADQCRSSETFKVRSIKK